MKTFYAALLILLSCFFSSAHALLYINIGTSQAFSLNSGDTLKVVTGTFTGSINNLKNGAVIIVSPGATFKPSSVNSLNGKIINYGACEFNSLGTYGNFQFENYNLLIVNGDLNLYNGATQIWNNHVAATMKIGGNFSMNNAIFTNYASLYVTGNFSLYAATSNFINRGLLSITGDLSMSNGILTNQNRIIADDFSAWGGQVINEGSISPKGDMTFGSGTNYTNRCLLIANTGFINFGNFTNNGMLWVGRSGTTDDHFYNVGTFTNAANAVVRTVKLTNYNVLNGGGNYFITGESYSSGTVGKSGTTTDSIKVYDVTRASSSRIFDTQWGTVHGNVVYRPFAQPDTNEVNYAGCSSYFRTDLSAVLPVEWNYFTAKLLQSQPALTWSAQYEASMKFEVERSYDNVDFTSAATVFSNTTKKYSYNDAVAQKNVIVYYRIKATSAVNGAVKYTETKTLKIGGTTVTNLSVYPNPVKSITGIQYNSDKAEQLIIRVSNAGGQKVFMKNVVAAKGANNFNLTEASQLNAGIFFVELINGNTVIATERFVKN